MNKTKDALWTDPEGCIDAVQRELGASREQASAIVDELRGCFEVLDSMRRDVGQARQAADELVTKLEDERRLRELIAELRANGEPVRNFVCEA